MRLSFVILSYNSARYIEKCTRSIVDSLDSTEPMDEIWIVDNGSTDGSIEILRELHAEFPNLLKVEYLPRNTGTTVSRNLALRQARGEFVVVMDSDVTVEKQTFEPLMARLKADPTCGMVAPLLTYPNGRLQISTDVFPIVSHKLKRFFALKQMERDNDQLPWPTEPALVDYAISAFWMLRREVIERVGPLDERIFYSPEDVDYCLRIWAAGFKIVYDPTVRVIHDAQEISRGFPIRKASWSHAKGLSYLFWKHRYMFGHRALYQRIGRFRFPCR